MSWNNQYPPPSGPPLGQFGSQYAPPPVPPPQGGYNPSYGPPSGPPPGQFSFPQPGGVGPGNNPSYGPSYAPPPGPPPIPANRPGGGYAPPPGPPPIQHRDSGGPGYPGQAYHQNQNNNNGQGWQQNNPTYPGGTPINWNNQGGAPNSNAGGAPPASWHNGAPGGQTGYGTGGPGHPGGAPAMGNTHMPPSGQQMYGSSQGGGPQMSFQYSMCTGRKKGLTVRHFRSTIVPALAEPMCRLVLTTLAKTESYVVVSTILIISRAFCVVCQFGYKNEDIVQLTDDSPNPRQKPTRANIIAAMQWLVKDAQPNDSLFFHYSGHGGQTKDLDGDEGDGQDEVIYPVDFEQNSHIVDDDMHAIMVQPLPPGCRLTAIFDVSLLFSSARNHLPYIYSTEGKIKEPNLLAEAGQGLLGMCHHLVHTPNLTPAAKGAGLSYARGDMSGVMKGLGGLLKTATGSNKKADAYARQTRTSPADVISWSGCKDSQTSADTVEAGEATGAMSYAFIEVLSRKPQQSYQELLNGIRDVLRKKYSQKPQLSSSHPMDTTVLFIA
ncbi:Ca(2+)-dependent cysteine protease [Ceratobasidium sp. 414]|nr:Ca(2+)-dependent cysteine protease [Ceratobasidium sp. 414]